MSSSVKFWGVLAPMIHSACIRKRHLQGLNHDFCSCFSHFISFSATFPKFFMISLKCLRYPRNLSQKRRNLFLFPKRRKPHQQKVHHHSYHECIKNLDAQSCSTLCDPVDCSPPGSPVHEILQAAILEWVAIPFSRGSS